ncbi:MAG: FAD/NAD(P)-binding protein [Acetobacteraceae bacterium]
MSLTLAMLERQVARDLALTAHPRTPWLTPRPGPDGRPALDVLVVGAGQSGLAVGFALLRDRVENILLVDRAAEGEEGPWTSYARMHTLRSWKDQTGPDLGVPSLTYQAWHEARFGKGSWEAMALIPKRAWADYLLWVRRMTGVPVRNRAEVASIGPATGADGSPLLAVAVRGEGGGETLYARKVVLATGQEGTGGWWMPPFVEALPERFRRHTADPIDPADLKGRTIAILGAGASAFDNAALALEAGAAEVHLFCRRAEPMVIQPYRWLTFAGFLRHMSEMPDEWRWRFMSYVLGLREGFPRDTYARVTAWPNFTMHVGRPWTGARLESGRAVVDTPRGPFAADLLLCGTGVTMDFARRPELALAADNIATWGDRYQPPEEERNDRLARFPYLSADYAFTEKVPGRTPWIRDLHLFGIGTTMSFGPAGSSINAMSIAVPKLVAGVTRGLFAADLDRQWRSLRAYDVPQVEIDPARIAAD